MVQKNASKVRIIAPSKWLMKSIKQSPLFKQNKIFNIPNILDTKTFEPIDKVKSRLELGLDPNTKYICFGAMYGPLVPYKGWIYLSQALQQLKNFHSSSKIEIITFGGDFSLVEKEIPYKIHSFGAIDNENKLNLIYNSASIFVAPSIEDNLPYTVLESVFAGTPVVAFKIGGIPEIIEHKNNGYLAKPKSSSDIAKGLAYFLENPEKQVTYLSKFNPESCLSKILEIYKESSETKI